MRAWAGWITTTTTIGSAVRASRTASTQATTTITTTPTTTMTAATSWSRCPRDVAGVGPACGFATKRRLRSVRGAARRSGAPPTWLRLAVGVPPGGPRAGQVASGPAGSDVAVQRAGGADEDDSVAGRVALVPFH